MQLRVGKFRLIGLSSDGKESREVELRKWGASFNPSRSTSIRISFNSTRPRDDDLSFIPFE